MEREEFINALSSFNPDDLKTIVKQANELIAEEKERLKKERKERERQEREREKERKKKEKRYLKMQIHLLLLCITLREIIKLNCTVSNGKRTACHIEVVDTKERRMFFISDLN
jgi:transposase